MEVNALKAAVDDGGVISSALSTLPNSILTSGVPTLSQLQVRFQKVYKAARQASMAPKGGTDLASQIFGMVFASFTFPPSIDNNPDEYSSQSMKSDCILSKAQRYVQLGLLENAIKQLNQLPPLSQEDFTIKDWKKDAQDRIAIQKASKIIHGECAFLNANMCGELKK